MNVGSGLSDVLRDMMEGKHRPPSAEPSTDSHISGAKPAGGDANHSGKASAGASSSKRSSTRAVSKPAPQTKPPSSRSAQPKPGGFQRAAVPALCAVAALTMFPAGWGVLVLLGVVGEAQTQGAVATAMIAAGLALSGVMLAAAWWTGRQQKAAGRGAPRR